MDNRIFNVNGNGDTALLRALRLAFEQEGDRTKCAGWKFEPENGIVLFWYVGDSDKDINQLPDLTADEVFNLVSAWLRSDDAKKVPCVEWDADYDHDGHNSLGWRVYCEDWGHVGNHRNAICAIKPAFMWHGK